MPKIFTDWPLTGKFANPYYVQIISHEGQGSILKSTKQKQTKNPEFCKILLTYTLYNKLSLGITARGNI